MPTLQFQISLSHFSLCTRINMPVINRGHHLHSPIYLSCTNLISSSVIRMLHTTQRTSLVQVRSRDRPGQLTSQIFSSLAKVTKSIVEKRRDNSASNSKVKNGPKVSTSGEWFSHLWSYDMYWICTTSNTHWSEWSNHNASYGTALSVHV